MHIQISSPRSPSAASARQGVVVALMVLVCVALLSACGSSGSSGTTVRAKINLNTPHVAAAIEQSVLNQRHVHARVSCPAVIPQQKGRTFVCIASVSEGSASVRGKTPFKVTIQNDKGYVTYKAE